MDEAGNVMLSPRLRECPDPLFRGLSMALRKTYFPLGMVVEVQSNHDAIIHAADQSFSLYGKPPSDLEPSLVFSFGVDLEAGHQPLKNWPQPQYRALQHLFHISCGDQNFATADLKTSTVMGFISKEMALDPAFFCPAFLECLFYVLAVHNRFTPVHCSCVAWKNEGILICGMSGAGKSTLAYACGRARMPIVSDDVAHLALEGKSGGLQVWGKPWTLHLTPDTTTFFSELESIQPTNWHGNESYLNVDVLKYCRGGICLQARPALLLFLQRNPNVQCELSRLSAEAVVKQLRKDIVLDTETVVERHDVLLGELARLPAYRLEYSGHPSSVTEIIKTIIH
ncbi:MAG: hypothetical protein U0V70_06020 [Terriglobia bacterium]